MILEQCNLEAIKGLISKIEKLEERVTNLEKKI